MANYEKQWSSANPGLLIILLDQSSSMIDEYCDGESKADFATKAVNTVIDAIINSNYDGIKPKDRCFIALIGYSSTVEVAKSGLLSELANNPLKTVQVMKKVNDGTGSLVDKPHKMQLWIEPKCNGATNMTAAFNEAKKVIDEFVTKFPDAPAPVIINISDGAPYIGGDYMDHEAAKKAAQSIMGISLEDGSPLIFNAHIEQGSFSVKFPASLNEIPQDPEVRQNAQFLFEISSPIPEAFRPAAEKKGLKVKENARGCMIGVDAVDLVKLIDFGSTKGLVDKKV